MAHSTSERPVNLYRQRGDREVWERAQKDADAADRSLSRHVVAVLREQQERADHDAERAARGPAPSCSICGESPPTSAALSVHQMARHGAGQ